MNYNIEEYFDMITEHNIEISSITKNIDDEKKKYEKKMELFNEQLRYRNNEINILREKIISIRLGDLIEEISWLSGIMVDNINTFIAFNLQFSNIDEMFKLFDDINNNKVDYFVKNTRFRLWSNTEQLNNNLIGFDYFMFLSFDMGSIQNDGKRFFSHCKFSVEPYSNGELLTTISVVKDIQDIICNFDMSILGIRNNTSWYPSDLLPQAIINCVKRDYNKKVDKVRERIKK